MIEDRDNRHKNYRYSYLPFFRKYMISFDYEKKHTHKLPYNRVIKYTI